MLLRFFGLLPFIILFLITTGCTPVQIANPEQDVMAKSFTVDSDKSNIYIYRNETYNFDTTMAVEIDGIHAGDTKEKTFILQTVKPGKHIVTAHGENTSEIELLTEAGKNYFVWLEVAVGAFIPAARLHEVNSEIGKSGVNECTLVK